MHLGEVQGDLPWGSDPKDLCSSWHRTEAQSCSPHIHCGCHSSTAAGVSGLQTSLRHTLVASNLRQSGHVENCLKLDPTSKRIGSAARWCSKAAGLWSKVEHCAMRKWHCQSWPWPLKVWEADLWQKFKVCKLPAVCGNGSKPWYRGEHQDKWQIDCDPQNITSYHLYTMQPPKGDWSSRENDEQAPTKTWLNQSWGQFSDKPLMFSDKNMPIQTTWQATSLMPSSFEIIRDNVRKATCQSWDAARKKAVNFGGWHR